MGRTAGRSYKAAPRQLLQVDAGGNASTSPTTPHAHAAHNAKEGEGAAREAAKIGREALGNAADVSNLLEGALESADWIYQGTSLVRKDPLTHREALVALEQLYDRVLDLEQRRRDQPPPEDVEEYEFWLALFVAQQFGVGI